MIKLYGVCSWTPWPWLGRDVTVSHIQPQVSVPLISNDIGWCVWAEVYHRTLQSCPIGILAPWKSDANGGVKIKRARQKICLA